MKKKTKNELITERWISVKQRVPKNRDIVLVTNNDSEFESEHWVCAGEINEDGEWCNQFNTDDTIIVTHWMPLPKPPARGSN